MDLEKRPIDVRSAFGGGVSGLPKEGLMGAAAISYEALSARYHGFELPEVVVKLEGEVLGEQKRGSQELMVKDVVVELTSGYEASVAHFRIYNVFDMARAVFTEDGIKEQVDLGAKLSIGLGYLGAVTEVFSGFVAEIHYIYEENGMPCIEVTGMDVKGAMMASCNAVQIKGRYDSDRIKSVFQKSSYSSLISDYKIDRTPDCGSRGADDFAGQSDLIGGGFAAGRKIEMADESDYDFVVKVAKKYSFEFFACGGTVYFRKSKSQTIPLMTLRYGKGLLFADLGMSIMGLVSKVETRGVDAGRGMLISAQSRVKHKLSAAGGRILSDSRKVYIDPSIRSKEDAEQRAQAIAEEIAYRFGSLSAECIGIPELIPGRFLKLAVLDGAESEFYITQVRHTLSAGSGFMTKITAEAAKK